MKCFGVRALVWLVLAVLVIAPGYSGKKKLHIVTSFLPVYCFTANVAGDAATVENLLPSSATPHDYQLSPSDIRKLAHADLIIVNGLGVESFLRKAIENAGPGTAEKVVTISSGLTSQKIPLSGTEKRVQSEYDPHIWLDPTLAKHCVTNILRALEKADPKNGASYRRHAAEYIGRIEILDGRISSRVEAIGPVAFVTYHNAFAYFVRHYRLSLAGVVERVPEVTPSPREMAELLGTIRSRHVKALFTEPSGSTRLSRQIAKDAGIKLAELDPLETGVLAPNTYEQVMLQNAEILVRTLR